MSLKKYLGFYRFALKRIYLFRRVLQISSENSIKEGIEGRKMWTALILYIINTYQMSLLQNRLWDVTEWVLVTDL